MKNRVRLKDDFEYIYLNRFVNKIPCWHIRKLLYRRRGLSIGQGSRIGIGTVIVCPGGYK